MIRGRGIDRAARWVALTWLLAMTVSVAGAPRQEALLGRIGFDQHVGQTVASELTFTNSAGEDVQLSQLLNGTPVVLVMAWYDCPNLCSMVLHNLARSVAGVEFAPGEDFRVVTVSIDPREGPAIARETRRQMNDLYEQGARPSPFHVLTGAQAAIDRLAQAIGFQYAYDAERDRFAHPAGAVVLTGDGRIARYLFGLSFKSRDLRLALMEASQGKLGSPIDRVVLRCYRFDPSTGAYTLEVMNIVRVAGTTTALLLGGFVLVMVRRERKRGGPGSGP